MPTLSLTHRQLITADEGSRVLHCALSLTLLCRPLTGSYLQLDQIFHHESDTSDSWRLRACSCRERHCMFKLSHTPLIPSSCLTGLFCFSRLLLVLKPPLRQCRFFPYRLGETGIWAAWFVHAGFFVLCVCPCLAVVSAGILCLVFKFLFLFWAPTTSGTGWISPATEQSNSLKFIFAWINCNLSPVSRGNMKAFLFLTCQ